MGVMIGAFAVRAAAGFGAVLIAMPMLAFVLPISTAVSVTTALTAITSVHQVSRDWRRVAWRHFAIMALYSAIGIGLGFYFIKMLDEHALRRSLGVFLILYSIYALCGSPVIARLPTIQRIAGSRHSLSASFTSRSRPAVRTPTDECATSRYSDNVRRSGTKFADSPLEGNGFEISVPRCLATANGVGAFISAGEWRLLEPQKQLYRFTRPTEPAGS